MRILAVFFVSSIVLMATSAFAESVVTASLDSAKKIATLIETDRRVKAEGDGSIKVTTAWPTMVPLHDASDLSIDNATLVYSAKVRSKDLIGKAYLEMWVRVKGEAYFSRGTQSFVEGTTKKWQTITTPFILQPGQVADQVMLNIVINGKGVVWIDDLVLKSSPVIPLPEDKK